MTAATSQPSRVGGENFDIPFFSDCATQTRGMQRTRSDINTPVTPNEMSQLEDFQIQRPDHQVRCNVKVGILDDNVRRLYNT